MFRSFFVLALIAALTTPATTATNADSDDSDVVTVTGTITANNGKVMHYTISIGEPEFINTSK